ncbi:selenocysteine lyase [Desulfitobacterium dichloroeliminans LMG P-21439]|uniref:cysteine desulfurase n=1 Tax=Desulfitobacterium dichloroeliminans (strain LMG P-21439 / DCA1) TaxID=871963 RepID=L0FA58_DESDL|nr:aminotransferase class V-fold PLP-dependent enzyme [Desulfitobacterium dichloroeliminans]AGA70699.1 selenocysteine lyase [Desulfitobacterium dichloroeliminans LMG P-21439]
MIYFDNSATTLIKPPEVSEAVAYAINHFGNASRSFYEAAMMASREIYNTRAEIAELVCSDNPLNVAFTSSSTESLNLVIGGLVKPDDVVLTTVTEHNSVLRPLYLKGCQLDFIDCDDHGVLLLNELESLIKPETRYLVCTHGSNVTGNITDVKRLYTLCKENNIIMILDVSQTLGLIPVTADMADVLCFTGHKGLFGPQGTGGVIVNDSLPFDIVKTGGAGVHSFEMFQQNVMPDIFEAGTLNGHGIYGLQKGVQFINYTGIEEIHRRERQLTQLFLDGLKQIQDVRLYGEFSSSYRLPVVALNIGEMPASDLSGLLWEKYGIATRAGSHCAPLLHKRFRTVETGIVRFSFSYFNTEEEIEEGIAALQNIARACGN